MPVAPLAPEASRSRRFLDTLAASWLTENVLVGSFVDGSVHLFDKRTSKSERSFLNHKGKCLTVMASRDAATLASGGSDQCVILYDSRQGCKHILKGHTGTVRSVCFVGEK